MMSVATPNGETAEPRTNEPRTSPIPVPETEIGKKPEAAPKKLRPTRISGTWIAVLIAIIVLIFLLIFILQNGNEATIHFLWGQFTLPLGVALLFGAIGGALLVAVVGAARILQLRRQAKRLTGRPATSSPARREN